VLNDVIKFESFASVTNSSAGELSGTIQRDLGSPAKKAIVAQFSGRLGGKENAGSEQDAEAVVLAPNFARSTNKEKIQDGGFAFIEMIPREGG